MGPCRCGPELSSSALLEEGYRPSALMGGTCVVAMPSAVAAVMIGEPLRRLVEETGWHAAQWAGAPMLPH